MKSFIVLLLAQLLVQMAKALSWAAPLLGDIEPFCRDPFKRTVSLKPVSTPTKLMYLKGNWFEIARIPSEVSTEYSCGQMLIYDQNDKFESPSKMLYLQHGRSIAVDFRLTPGNIDETKLISDLFKKVIHMWILEVHPEFEWIVFGEPCKKTAWIFSVTPKLEPDVLKARIDSLKKVGFNVNNLFYRDDQNCPDALPKTSMIPGNPTNAKELDKAEVASSKKKQREEDDKVMGDREKEKEHHRLLRKDRVDQAMKAAAARGLPYFPEDQVAAQAEHPEDDTYQNDADLADLVEEKESEAALEAENDRAAAKRAEEARKSAQLEVLNIKLGQLYTEKKRKDVKRLLRDDGLIPNVISAKEQVEAEIGQINAELEDTKTQVGLVESRSVVLKAHQLEVDYEAALRSQKVADSLRYTALKKMADAKIRLDLAPKELSKALLTNREAAEADLKAATEKRDAALAEYNNALHQKSELRMQYLAKAHARVLAFKTMQNEELKPKPRSPQEKTAHADAKVALKVAVEAERQADKAVTAYETEVTKAETKYRSAAAEVSSGKHTLDRVLLDIQSEDLQVRTTLERLAQVYETAKTDYDESSAAMAKANATLAEASTALKVARVEAALEKKTESDLLMKHRVLLRRLFKAKTSLNGLVHRLQVATANKDDSEFLEKYYALTDQLALLTTRKTGAMNDLVEANDKAVKAEIVVNQGVSDGDPEGVIEAKTGTYKALQDKIPPLEAALKAATEQYDDKVKEVETLKSRYSNVVLKRQQGLALSTLASNRTTEDNQHQLNTVRELIPAVAKAVELLKTELSDHTAKAKAGQDSLVGASTALAKVRNQYTLKRHTREVQLQQRSYLLAALLDIEVALRIALNNKEQPEPQFAKTLLKKLDIRPIEAAVALQTEKAKEAQDGVAEIRKNVFIAEASIIQHRATLKDLLAKPKATWKRVSEAAYNLKAALVTYDSVVLLLNQAKAVQRDVKRTLLSWNTKLRIFRAGLVIGKAYEQAVHDRWVATTTTEAEAGIQGLTLRKQQAQSTLKDFDQSLGALSKDIDELSTSVSKATAEYEQAQAEKDSQDKAVSDSHNALQKKLIRLAALKNKETQLDLALQIKELYSILPGLEMDILDQTANWLEAQKVAVSKAGIDDQAANKALEDVARFAKQVEETKARLAQTRKKVSELEVRLDQMTSNTETVSINSHHRKAVLLKNAQGTITQLELRYKSHNELLETLHTKREAVLAELTKARAELKRLTDTAAASLAEFEEALELNKEPQEVAKLKDAYQAGSSLIAKKRYEVDTISSTLSSIKGQMSQLDRQVRKVANDLGKAKAKEAYYTATLSVTDQEGVVYKASQFLEEAHKNFETALTDEQAAQASAQLVDAQKSLDEATKELSALKSKASALWQPIKDSANEAAINAHWYQAQREATLARDLTKAEYFDAVKQFHQTQLDDLKAQLRTAQDKAAAARTDMEAALKASSMDSAEILALNSKIRASLQVDPEVYTAAMKKSTEAKAKSSAAKEQFIIRKKQVIILARRVRAAEDQLAEATKDIQSIPLLNQLTSAKVDFGSVNLELKRAKQEFKTAKALADLSKNGAEHHKFVEAATRIENTITDLEVKRGQAKEKVTHLKVTAETFTATHRKMTLTEKKLAAQLKVIELRRIRLVNKESIANHHRTIYIKKNEVAAAARALKPLYTSFSEARQEYERAVDLEGKRELAKKLEQKRLQVDSAKLDIKNALVEVEKALYDWTEAKQYGLSLETQIKGASAEVKALGAAIPMLAAKRALKAIRADVKGRAISLTASKSELLKQAASLSQIEKDIEEVKFKNDIDNKKATEASHDYLSQKVESVEESQKMHDAKNKLNEAKGDLKVSNTLLAELQANKAGIENNIKQTRSLIEDITQGLQTSSEALKASEDRFQKASSEYDGKILDQRQTEVLVVGDIGNTVKRQIYREARLIYRTIKITTAVDAAKNQVTATEKSLSEAEQAKATAFSEYKTKLQALATAMKSFKAAAMSTDYTEAISAVLKAVGERDSCREALFTSYVNLYLSQLSHSKAVTRLGVANQNLPKAKTLEQYMKAEIRSEELESQVQAAVSERDRAADRVSVALQRQANLTVDTAIVQDNLKASLRLLENYRAQLLQLEPKLAEARQARDQSAKEFADSVEAKDQAAVRPDVKPDELSKVIIDTRLKEYLSTAAQGRLDTMHVLVGSLKRKIQYEEAMDKYTHGYLQTLQDKRGPMDQQTATDQAALQTVLEDTLGPAASAYTSSKFQELQASGLVQDQIVRACVNYVDLRVHDYLNRIVADIENSDANRVLAQTPEVDPQTAAGTFSKARRSLQTRRITSQAARQFLAANPGASDAADAKTAAEAGDGDLLAAEVAWLDRWTSDKTKAYRHDLAALRKDVAAIKNSAFAQVVALQTSRFKKAKALETVETTEGKYLFLASELLRLQDEKTLLQTEKTAIDKNVNRAKAEVETARQALEEAKKAHSNAGFQLALSKTVLTKALSAKALDDRVTSLEIDIREKDVGAYLAGDELILSTDRFEKAQLALNSLQADALEVDRAMGRNSQESQDSQAKLQETDTLLSSTSATVDSAKEDYFEDSLQLATKKMNYAALNKAAVYLRVFTGRARANTHVAIYN